MEFNGYMIRMHVEDTKYYLYILCILFTIILPIIVFAIFYKLGLVTDVNLTKRRERVIPFYLSIILFTTFYYMVRSDEQFNEFLYPIIFGSLSSTFIANNITLFWKISIHCLGISGVLGAVAGLAYLTEYNEMILILLLSTLTIIVGLSRVILKRHTIAQVLAGTSLGFSGTFLACVFFVYV